MDYGWDVVQCIKKPRGIAKHYDYDFYLERIPVEPQDYEKQNRELSLKALEFLKYNFDFDVIFYSLGEQLMPILLGMRQFSAQKHVFITSSSKNAKALKRFFEERKKTNEHFQINTDRLHSIEVNVFEPKNIYENILEYTNKNGLKDKRLCFNLTGGTKMMFLAGLKASECFQAPYFYIEEKAQRLLFFKNPSGIEPFVIPAIPIKDVETFFSLHVPNRRIKQNGIIDEKSLEKIQEHKNLSNLLYEHCARIIPLYQRINDNYAKDKTINICENNLKLFYKDHQVCVNIDGKKIELRYSEDEDDFRKYIIGGWFEEYIYCELLELLDKQVIYDLRLNMTLGVENTNAIQGDKRPIYAELDIAFSDGKNLYVVECKSGELQNKGVLTALSTNAQIFGGTNAKCILIPIDSNLGKGIQEKVKILNIKFIFKDFKKILRIILITLGVNRSERGCLVGVKPICYWTLEFLRNN
ncbi:Card1-like endonuclease domain-containing protein [Helicobacter pylori]|uniref:Card1-like endonuclease domain-containing protein n=1 Tax=Helicobacter pylori TaxID=210 RepID=UPI003F8E0F4F